MAATPSSNIKLKKRSKNFSVDEILFIEEVEKYSDIITAKQSNFKLTLKRLLLGRKLLML